MGSLLRNSYGARTPIHLAAALLGAAVLMALLFPPSFWHALPELCPFRRLTGLPCPTCGLSRSWAALLHGDLRGAFAFHLGGPPLLGAGLLSLILALRKGAVVPPSRAWALALGVVWVGYAGARMAGYLPIP